MKKQELIETLAARTNESKKTTETFLSEFTNLVIESMKEHETVDIYGFGKFEAVHKEAGTGRNPKTGESTNIPAKDVPKFRFSSAVKKALNE